MTVADATKIFPQEILDELGGLPERFIHCAGLARDTLVKAIINYHNSGFKKSPWKKMYRNM